jgi:hypothetical protein
MYKAIFFEKYRRQIQLAQQQDTSIYYFLLVTGFERISNSAGNLLKRP